MHIYYTCIYGHINIILYTVIFKEKAFGLYVNRGFILHIACFYSFDIPQFKPICIHLIKMRCKSLFSFIFSRNTGF